MRRTLFVAGAILCVAAAPYLLCPIYRFAAPAPFAGAAFYNPYADLASGDHWRTANFHAHGRAWGGLTEGRQPDSAVVAHYRALGYEIAGVSDYHHIDHTRDGDSTFVPSYEHGYNILKTHFLALGARRVVWLDFPFALLRSQKQFVIDRMADNAELVVMAHPAMRGGESAEDVRYLTRYELFEVLNHFVVSDSLWDVALSSGHAVWALGSDDTHNINDAGQTGADWTMIDAPSTRAANVLAALKAGRAYAVAGRGGVSDAHPERVVVHGDTLTVTCDTTVRRIDFIGQGGRLLGRAYNTRTASYAMTPDDPYVRTVIFTPRTTMYMNPVIRYDGRTLARPTAIIDPARTWSLRLGVLMIMLLLVWLSPLRTAALRTALGGAGLPSPVR